MLPTSKIWVPNLRVYQYSSLVDEIDYSNEDAKINYKEYGSTIISSYCSILGKYYPMDQHNCLLNFQYKVKGLNAMAGFRPNSEIIGKFRKLEKFYDHFVKRQK